MSEIKLAYKESEGFYIFSVADNGVGMTGEEDDKIFDLFQRGRTSKDKEGTGLGLGIVNEIAVKHNGKAWADSGSGKGATIYVSISKDL